MKLTIATTLGAFRAKHGTDVVPLGHRLPRVHFLSDVDACGTGCTFRSQSKDLSLAVQEEHLLLYNFTSLASRLLKEGEILHDGRPQLLEAVAFDGLTKDALDPLKSPGFIREDVIHPLHCAKFHCLAGGALENTRRAYAKPKPAGQAMPTRRGRLGWISL